MMSSALYPEVVLPGLGLLAEPERLAEVIREGLLSSQAVRLETPPKVWQQAAGKHCIAQVRLSLGGAKRRVALKFYPSGKADEAYETLEALWHAGFSAPPYTICEPLGRHAPSSLLILAWAEGTPLRRHLLTGEDDFSGRAEGAARWLLKLHHCRVQRGIYDIAQHLHTLAENGTQLAALDADLGDRYHRVLSEIEKRWRLMPKVASPTHLDFSPDHLFFDRTGIRVMDFDDFCRYDSLFDVAHFLAHLRCLALERPAQQELLDSLADRFLRCYRKGAAEFSFDRLQMHSAAAFLKLMYIAGMVRNEGKEMMNLLLAEAEGSL